MSSNDSLEELAIRETRIKELHERFGSYGHASEDFWKTFDELKVLLLDTIQMAHRLGRKEDAYRYREMFDEIMDRVPSGYWK